MNVPSYPAWVTPTLRLIKKAFFAWIGLAILSFAIVFFIRLPSIVISPAVCVNYIFAALGFLFILILISEAFTIIYAWSRIRKIKKYLRATGHEKTMETGDVSLIIGGNRGAAFFYIYDLEFKMLGSNLHIFDFFASKDKVPQKGTRISMLSDPQNPKLVCIKDYP